jgi:Flp pilus assembly protein TadD
VTGYHLFNLAVIRLAPNHASVHNLLGASLASEGRVAEAIAEFRRAVALDPDDRQARKTSRAL